MSRVSGHPQKFWGMKKCIVTLIALLSISLGMEIKAQNAKDCELPVMVTVSDKSALNSEVANLLKARLERIVCRDGFGGADMSHLCLTASVVPIDKEIMSGMRPLVTAKVEVTLVMSNLMGGEKFGAITTTLSGGGKNEDLAVKSAIARMNANDKTFQDFMKQCHAKVFDYYRAHIPAIIKQSEVMANRGEYEKALYSLACVPPCVEGYDKVGDAMLAVWQEYLDEDCSEKLAKAKAVWHSSQTEEAAKIAAAYLASINRKSACVEEAEALLAEISDKISGNISRLLAQEDEDRAFNKDQARIDNELRQQQIDAIRELSLSYVQNVVGPLVDNMSRQPDININHYGAEGNAE